MPPKLLTVVVPRHRAYVRTPVQAKVLLSSHTLHSSQSPTTLVSPLGSQMLVEIVEQKYPLGQLVGVPVGMPSTHTWNCVCDTQAKLVLPEQALQTAETKFDDLENRSKRITMSAR